MRSHRLVIIGAFVGLSAFVGCSKQICDKFDGGWCDYIFGKDGKALPEPGKAPSEPPVLGPAKCGGLLAFQCPAPGTCCEGLCFDLQKSILNCGGCGMACGDNADNCAGATCKCGTGPACGNLSCVNGQCECTKNADCPNEQVCNRVTGVCAAVGCVPAWSGCEAPEYLPDCPDPEYLLPATGTGMNCLDDVHLTDNGKAAAMNLGAGGLCVDLCNDGAHCGWTTLDNSQNISHCTPGNVCCGDTYVKYGDFLYGGTCGGGGPGDPVDSEGPSDNQCKLVLGLPISDSNVCDFEGRLCE